MPLSSMHKGILVGLAVGVIAYHFWTQRAGSGPSTEGG